MGAGVWCSSCNRVALCGSRYTVSTKKVLLVCCKTSHSGFPRVSFKGGILLANLLQSSRSTFAGETFPSFFAFQEGMWGTQISALLSSPTVSVGFLRRQDERCGSLEQVVSFFVGEGTPPTGVP